MARNYAALPHEYLEELDALNDAEFGRLTRALLKYSMTGEKIALCGNERFYAKRLMAQEDRFKESYDEITAKKSSAGKAGAEARWQNDGKNGSAIADDGKNGSAIADDGKNGSAIADMADDGKNGNTETNTNTETKYKEISSNEDTKKSARFSPPTLDEVKAYCLERKNGVDAERWYNYYSANGWMVGKNHMKDWKAAVRTWEKDTKPEKPKAESIGKYMNW